MAYSDVRLQSQANKKIKYMYVNIPQREPRERETAERNERESAERMRVQREMRERVRLA